MRILVAEENPLTRNLLADTLEQWGHDVEQCSDGDQVWQAVQREDPPEIAIFGNNMPGMTGVEICRNLGETKQPSSCYAMMLVFRDHPEEGLEALEAGADDYICKPFTLSDLKARINTATRIVEMNMDRVDRETAHYVDQLEQAVNELQESRTRIVNVQEAVRRDIAADLHGHVQTEMSLLYFKLQDVKEEIEPASTKMAKDIEKIAEELDHLRESAIRKLSQRLYPSRVRIGFAPGLRSLMEKYAESLGVHLEIAEQVLDMEPAGESHIPFNVRLALYRIAEEAVLNVVNHAKASNAFIRVWFLDARQNLCISVEDDGCGFDPQSDHTGLGLATMNDYVGTIGGLFQVDSTPGRGTTVTAIVPMSIEA